MLYAEVIFLSHDNFAGPNRVPSVARDDDLQGHRTEAALLCHNG